MNFKMKFLMILILLIPISVFSQSGRLIKGKVVAVGSIAHPMEEKHYIEWIEATSEEGEISKIFLEPHQEPEAEFCFQVKSARAYCNLHGLWKSIE